VSRSIGVFRISPDRLQSLQLTQGRVLLDKCTKRHQQAVHGRERANALTAPRLERPAPHRLCTKHALVSAAFSGLHEAHQQASGCAMHDVAYFVDTRDRTAVLLPMTRTLRVAACKVSKLLHLASLGMRALWAWWRLLACGNRASESTEGLSTGKGDAHNGSRQEFRRRISSDEKYVPCEVAHTIKSGTGSHWSMLHTCTCEPPCRYYSTLQSVQLISNHDPTRFGSVPLWLLSRA